MLWKRSGNKKYLTVIIATLILLFLVVMTANDSTLKASQESGLTFGLLLLFVLTFSAPLPDGRVSLAPLVMLAALLVTGPLITGWIVYVIPFIYGGVRLTFADQLGEARELDYPSVLFRAMSEATVFSLSILAAGVSYQLSGGVIPLLDITWDSSIPLLSLFITFMVFNYLLPRVLGILTSREHTDLHAINIKKVVFYEGGPTIFAPVISLVYTNFHLGVFLVAALAVGGTALVTRSMAFARRDMERQIRDLGGLREVGRVLSHSLDLDEVLYAVYQQVARLMPAESFYVALYQPDRDVISFPLVIENGDSVTVPSRRGGQGLIETILHTKSPLRNRQRTDILRRRLGLDNHGKPPTSWLGVPIVAADEVLGVVAIQSYSVFDLYDERHEEILSTIVSQAAVAIQNARLYAKTDEALAHKVEEMTSILRTVEEGICLVDREGNILSLNRALAEYLGCGRIDLIGKNLLNPKNTEGRSFLEKIGYASDGFNKDVAALERADVSYKIQTIATTNSKDLYWERRVAPVVNEEGRISGWLIVLRDVTDEITLDHMQKDMLNMLVHDLRSPLTVIQSSLGTIKKMFKEKGWDESDRLIGLAQRAGRKLLHMVNLMLDVSKLEEGELGLERDWFRLSPLLEESAQQFYSAIKNSNLKLEILSDHDGVEVYADRDQMERVFTNLLDNAIKFTPDGGRITIWTRPDPKRDVPAVLIGVRDTGPGIPEESQKRIFQKYQQHPSENGRRTGTGLGLYYCKLVVEAHGGEISLESHEGEGSTFVISLPTFRKLSS